MKDQRSLQLAGGVALFGLGWLSRDVVWAWRNAPYDWGAGWIALAWAGWVLWHSWRRGPEPRASWLGAGIVLGLLSWIGELNAAAHAGLVLAASAWLPLAKLRVAGVVMGLAWLPAFGWLGSNVVSPVMMLAVRGVLLVGVGMICLGLRAKEDPS